MNFGSILGMLIGYGLFGLIPAFIARHKGKKFIIWWIYGTLFFMVLHIVSLLLFTLTL
jgi:hypothetical protein